MWLLLGLALAPIIFLMTWLFISDKYQKEPFWVLLFSFFLGAVVIIPAVFAEIYLDKLFNIQLSSGWEGLFVAMVNIALVEEGLKYSALRLFIYNRKAFDEPFDGIVYAVTISMGFAAFENVMYVMDNGVTTAILRMFTAVPGHAMFGVLMGFFVGYAKFQHNKWNAWLLRMTGLLAAIIPHGLYDYFVLQTGNISAYFVLAIVVLLVAAFLSYKAIRIHQRNSPFMPKPENLQ